VCEAREQRGRDRADVGVRIFLAGAIERLGRQAIKAEFMGVQGVLAGENEYGFDPVRGQRTGDGSEFYCFGPGADDQPDIGETQPSP
jgi:hypothetical protein